MHTQWQTSELEAQQKKIRALYGRILSADILPKVSVLRRCVYSFMTEQKMPDSNRISITRWHRCASRRRTRPSCSSSATWPACSSPLWHSKRRQRRIRLQRPVLKMRGGNPRGPRCAVGKDFLRGECTREKCYFSHKARKKPKPAAASEQSEDE